MIDERIYSVIQNAAARPGRSLAGRWRSIVDPYEVGYRSIYGDPWELGFWREFPLRPGLGEYDFDRSDLLNVPGDWNSQDPRLFFYEGNVWYKRVFEGKPSGKHRYFIHFGAANYATRVYLNGAEIGSHEGGFTPFCFEISEALRDGDNTLIVKVDASRRPDGVPGPQTDWWNYGGITRDVRLLELPTTFVRDYWLRRSETGGIEGYVELDGAEPRLAVRLAIEELGVDVSLEPNAAGRVEITLDVSPEPWSPDAPRCYEVVLFAGDDVVIDQIGFRSVAVRGSEILLNGEPVFLRGISIHEEAPGRDGRAFGEGDARTLLGWAKELGCNFVRLAHYTHDEATLRVADELGLLVWGEVPVYWNLAWANQDTLVNAKYQLRTMLERDRNRACFVLCSIGNEAPGTPERLAFMGALAAHARETDPTRLVTCALMARHHEGQMIIEDAMAEHLDVMGCNEYLGWYYGEVADVANVRWKCDYQKPLVMSELGAGALAGSHGAATELFSEEHQASVYAAQIAMLEKIPFLAGLSPWILKDFRTPRRLLPGIQDYYNRKGLVSERGQRKQAFGVLQAWYRKLASLS